MELLLIHNPGQAKVGKKEIRIIFWGTEQQVLRLEISVHNSMVMQVSHGRQDGTD